MNFKGKKTYVYRFLECIISLSFSLFLFFYKNYIRFLSNNEGKREEKGGGGGGLKHGQAQNHH